MSKTLKNLIFLISILYAVSIEPKFLEKEQYFKPFVSVPLISKPQIEEERQISVFAQDNKPKVQTAVKCLFLNGYDVYDISGIRVVCNYIRDIYMLIYLLEEQEDLEVRIKKDYILNPKESGYRSVHVVFQTRVTMSSETRWVPVEIQFRTIAMDMWASLDHELRYKSKYELDDEANERLRMYADELYKIDTNMQRIFIKSTSEGDFND